MLGHVQRVVELQVLAAVERAACVHEFALDGQLRGADGPDVGAVDVVLEDGGVVFEGERGEEVRVRDDVVWRVCGLRGTVSAEVPAGWG